MTASPSITNRFCYVLQRSFDDPTIALSPVMVAPRDQADAIAVALSAEAETVVFDLVEPVVAGRDGLAGRWYLRSVPARRSGSISL